MSTGGIFTIITNDGKQDRMLMATALLEKRLKTIREQRAGTADPNPTLVDIEKTHLLFVNAHFKPFAAIGYEYNKVQATSGNPNFGGRLQYNIPQFGDFFSDMALHVLINSVKATSVQSGTTKVLPAVRYCDYPGERLMQRVQMEVNGNLLDEYVSDTYNAYRQFSVQPNKLPAWKRCMGQEEPVESYSVDNGSWVPSDRRVAPVTLNGFQTPKNVQPQLELFVPLMFWFNKDPRLAIPSVSIPQGQRFINVDLATASQMLVAINRGNANIVGSLNDTTKTVGGLSDDAAYSDNASGSAPTIASAYLYINNIFVNPDVHDIFIARIGFSLIRVHKRHTAALTTNSNRIQLTQLKWPIESLFVGFRPNANTKAGSTYGVSGSLKTSDALKVAQDWHRFSNVAESVVTDNATVAKASLLREFLYVISQIDRDTTAPLSVYNFAWIFANLGAIPISNDLKDFINYHKQTTAPYPIGNYSMGLAGDKNATTLRAYPPTQDFALVLPINQIIFNNEYPTHDETVAIEAMVNKYYEALNLNNSAVVRTCTPMTRTLKIDAHGIPIYNELPAQFFNNYTPLVYGGANVTSPTDPGAYFIPFCLYPGAYQPSGHINVSRAREFFLEYRDAPVNGGTAATITKDNAAELVVIATALNFLLISDGSAVLRYST
jgi:hypothetical protein